MTNYILADAAEADMRDIIRYTREQWGDAQLRHYIVRLESGITRLASGDGPYKDMSAIFPALRMIHFEHHYIFGLMRENAPTMIVAILHERMDLMKRLADRFHV